VAQFTLVARPPFASKIRDFRTCTVVHVILFFLSAYPLAAQTSISQPKQDSQSVALISSMVAACGWSSPVPTSVVAKGAASSFGEQPEPIVIEAAPGYFRLERPQSNVVVLVHGPIGLISENGTRTRMKGGVASSIQPWIFPFYTELATVGDSHLSITDGGGSSVASVPVQLINLESFAKSNDGMDSLRHTASKITVSVSKSNFTPVQIHFFRTSRESSRSGAYVDAYLSDYRPVNGILLPFRYEERVGEHSQMTIQLQSVEFNSAIPSADFNLF
jgi:hypothetical protein